MRSSNKRSRSKSNRNRPSGGNIVNRVFDSSGPEGKVRGTPQQIIDKYNQLTRDAQLSNDRVAAENFAQHAEHYTRMLAEAQREADQRRDQADQQNRDRQQQNNPQGDGSSGPSGDGGGQQGGEGNRADDRGQGQQGGGDRRSDERGQQPDQPRPDDRGQKGGDEAAPVAQAEAPSAEGGEGGETPAKPRRRTRKPREDKAARDGDVIDPGTAQDSGLVETPENKPKRRTRKPKAEKPDEGGGGSEGGETQAVE